MVWITVTFALVALVIWHNYWLSGWLLYPSTAIDLFNPDWKVPAYLVQNQQDVTSAFAKSSGSLQHVKDVHSMSLFEWVPIWFQDKSSQLWVIYGAIISICLGWGMIVGKQEFRKKAIVALISTMTFATVLWFLTAPSPRFGFALLYGLILSGSYLLISAIGFKLSIKQLSIAKIAGLSVLSLLFIKWSSLGSAITDGYPPLNFDLRVEIPETEFKKVHHSSYPNEIFYTPVMGEQPFLPDIQPVASRIYTDSILPFINDVPRWRGDRVEDGYWTDSLETVRR